MKRRVEDARRLAADRVCGDDADELSRTALRALAVLVWVVAPLAGMFVMAFVFKKVMF